MARRHTLELFGNRPIRERVGTRQPISVLCCTDRVAVTRAGGEIPTVLTCSREREGGRGMMTDCVYWHHPIETNHNQIIGHDVTCTLNMSYEDPKRDIRTRYMEARYLDPFKCDLEIIAPRKRELEID